MKKIISVVLALILVSAMSVSAFAAGSVVAPVVKDFEGGKATYTATTNSSEYTFTADAKDGYNFVGWEISGNYEIVSGSLTSSTITVKYKDGTALTAVSAVPVFEKITVATTTTDADDDEPTTKKPATTKKPTTTKKADTSPVTGDSMAMVMLAVAALGGVVVSKKKLAK